MLLATDSVVVLVSQPELYFTAEPLLVEMLHRIPDLENTEIRQLLNGPESFTPDGHYVLGEAPQV